MTFPRRILVVEDEPLIQMMLEDYLDLLGRELAGSATTVADALSAVARGGIDAAIVDVNLERGEKSWPVADALAAAGIPFVFASGGADHSIAEAYRDRPLLPKPYTMEGVEKALDALG